MPLSATAAVQTLKDAAQQAILENPEVMARYHALQAAKAERSAATGAFLPRVDINAAAGKEKRDDPLRREKYSRHSTSVTLSQMLYDGFAASNEAGRLDHLQKTRLYELQDISETVALDVARTYFDVLRYRKLVALAKDNYVRHRTVFEQIQRKTQAGVARRVDLEQAAGRLSLAESNLLTETANLHDVSARYQRLVGVFPAKEMEEPSNLGKNMPSDIRAGLSQALSRHPSVLGAIEFVQSSDRAAAARRSVYQPRFDLRVRSEKGDNINGIVGQQHNSGAEVVMSWNLFNGLADRSRARQFAEQANVARDQRDKACRDLRQTVMIAYNDVRKLNEQLTYLDQHQLSIEKARDAYRKQFDIGQRTLLDLLDTENELFQARRAYANASYDLLVSQARTYAGLGRLTAELGLSRPDAGSDAAAADYGKDGTFTSCGPEAPVLYTVDKTTLDARAQEIIRESAAAMPRDATEPAVAIRPVAEALKAWSDAWAARDAANYLAAYSQRFLPADGKSREAWEAGRKATLARAGRISLDLSDMRIEMKDATHAVARFRQAYRSASYQDSVQKTLEWENSGGKWLIVSETAKPD
ncbi:MAG: hypothetical protein K0S28_787 [Paucimonas sp.]|nr:hypothetical protein [Paucimonas sp.]